MPNVRADITLAVVDQSPGPIGANPVPFTFDIPPDREIPLTPHAILWFFRRANGANQLQYVWTLNGTEVRRVWPVNGDHQGTIHEVLQNPPLRYGANILEVRVESGNGELYIGDVLITLTRFVVMGTSG